MRAKTFTATTESLPLIRSFALEEARLAGLCDEAITNVDLVLEELVVNVINYAYQKTAGEITCHCGKVDSEYVIQIADSGPEFNPLEVPPPDLTKEPEDRPIGGLGIFLVKQLSTTQRYARLEGQNVLTIGFAINR